MVEVVNVVASGSLLDEIDLEAIATEFENIVEYTPARYPGAYFRLDENSPLITLYRTGKYIVTGADSKDSVLATRTRFLDLLQENGVIEESGDNWFSVQNCVCVADFKQPLNLNALAVDLGLEHTEYEPEQFPGLIFRPTDRECVVLLFASGKIVITGSHNEATAKRMFEDLQSFLPATKHEDS